jgi:2-oxoglutarate ferredoxin oxidoreductase subunit delta
VRKLWRRPLDSDRIKVQRGEVHVIEDRCKGCGFCIEYCPRDVLALSDKFNAKGYHPPDVAKPDACVNCGLCELICPEFAIFSTAVEECEANQEGA